MAYNALNQSPGDASLVSNRFDRIVVFTRHALARMVERDIDEALIMELLETGIVHEKDASRFWIAKAFPERSDNLICAAVVAEDKLVIKTVMHHFSWGEAS
ncbi:MAG TPA: DUF4258 domain-containing protein [Opitutaceae bacterium]|nr:DUF4258 domain-containing protein [Opitutaceae bacterium]